jgi:hypothetical protein
VVRNWRFRFDGLIDVEASVKVKAPVPAVWREIVDPEWWERGSKQTAALERGNG